MNYINKTWGPVSFLHCYDGRSVETFLQLRYHSQLSGDGGGFITSHRGCVFVSHHRIFLMTPGDISSCFCVDQNKLFPWSWHQNRYFEPNRDVFLTLTKWFVTREEIGPKQTTHRCVQFELISLVLSLLYHDTHKLGVYWQISCCRFHVVLFCSRVTAWAMQTILKNTFKSKTEVATL